MGMTTVQLATFSVAEIISVAELWCIETGLNLLFFKRKTCKTHTHRHSQQNTALGQDWNIAALSLSAATYASISLDLMWRAMLKFDLEFNSTTEKQ